MGKLDEERQKRASETWAYDVACAFPDYSAEDERKLRALQVRGESGRRLYGWRGGNHAPALGRPATSGELASGCLSREAGSGGFPSPIAHAARLETAPSVGSFVPDVPRDPCWPAYEARIPVEQRQWVLQW